MGIQEVPDGSPETWGLPEYCHISEMRSEIDGHDVRLVFGHRRFGQVQWLYTVVVTPEALISLTQECRSAAEQALNLNHLMGRVSAH